MESSHENSNQFGTEVLAEFLNIPILPVLTSLDKTLHGKKSYDNKVSVIVSVCQTVAEFLAVQSSPSDVIERMIEFVYYGTLKVVLDCRWLKVGNVTKNHVSKTLKKCLDYFRKTNSVSSLRYVMSLITLVKDPWGHQTLKKIMNDEILKEDEVIEFFNRETILLLGLRVRSLIEAKSEDLALKLVSFVIQYCGLSKNALIHLFIRLITNIINDIEEAKLKKDENKVSDIEKKLCNIFLVMFNLFYHGDCKGISRECLLTAFSLDPVSDIFKLIELCSERDFSISPENDINQNSGEETFVRAPGALPPDTGKFFTESVNYDPYAAPNDVLEECEKLEIPKELAHDLISVICYPRYKRLSWMYEWSKLRENCEMYMKNGVSVRNPTKDLKYLNIDFNLFLETINKI